MRDYIFTDDLSEETLGGLPRYWTIEPPPGGGGSYRSTTYLRVGLREGEKVVEARVPKLYQLGYARGPDFEQIWYLSARLCGLSSLTPFGGLPNLGVGDRSGEWVRFGLCPHGSGLSVAAQGCLSGQWFREYLLQVPIETADHLHTYALCLIPTLAFWFDGQPLGGLPFGAWNLGGGIRLEAYSDQWGGPGASSCGLSFTQVELEGGQPHQIRFAQPAPPGDPLLYRTETYHLNDNYAYGRPEGWRTAIRVHGAGEWLPHTEVSPATHLNLAPLPDARLLATWFDPTDNAIRHGPPQAGALMLQDHYYPSLLFMPDLGLTLLVCYREGDLLAFHGRQTPSGQTDWDTDSPFVVTQGNAFPQQAALRQDADGKIILTFLDRDKEVQELTSTDFGQTWT